MEEVGMNLIYKQNKFVRSLLLMMLCLVIFISTVSFSHKYHSSDKPYAKIDKLENNISNIKSAINLDSIKQYNIQKIISIINYYNKKIDTDEKFSIANEIYEMSLKYDNLSVDLICATITHESALTWRKTVTSPVGALGLMQIMPRTGKVMAEYEGIEWVSPEKILFDPILNIRLGCRYLSFLIKHYEIDGGLAAYNGGERRAALWLKKRNNKTDWAILWEETQTYVPAVLKLYEKYQRQTGIL